MRTGSLCVQDILISTWRAILITSFQRRKVRKNKPATKARLLERQRQQSLLSSFRECMNASAFKVGPLFGIQSSLVRPVVHFYLTIRVRVELVKISCKVANRLTGLASSHAFTNSSVASFIVRSCPSLDIKRDTTCIAIVCI